MATADAKKAGNACDTARRITSPPLFTGMPACSQCSMGARRIFGRVGHGDLGNLRLGQSGTTTLILPFLLYRHVIQVHATNDCESELSEYVQGTV